MSLHLHRDRWERRKSKRADMMGHISAVIILNNADKHVPSKAAIDRLASIEVGRSDSDTFSVDRVQSTKVPKRPARTDEHNKVLRAVLATSQRVGNEQKHISRSENANLIHPVKDEIYAIWLQI